ncbi:MAG: extensin family protein [Polyangiaceae bacterium]|nr:extensin family protein [Polyangiaceae bacterium]
MRPWVLCALLSVSLSAASAAGNLGDALAQAGAAAKGAPKASAKAPPPKPGSSKAPVKSLSIKERFKRWGLHGALAESKADHAKRQWENLASVDGAQCREELKKTGAVFRALRDREKPDHKGCGIPHGVILTKGPTGITYAGPLMIDCSLALALPSIEKVIQEEAVKHLGEPITRITTLGSYSCRSVRGWKERISQHAIGNALDMAAFSTKGGVKASVMRDYEMGVESPAKPRGRFLRAIYRRLWSEGDVARVLGPEWDAAHRDHFHLDRGLRFWK